MPQEFNKLPTKYKEIAENSLRFLCKHMKNRKQDFYCFQSFSIGLMFGSFLTGRCYRHYDLRGVGGVVSKKKYVYIVYEGNMQPKMCVQLERWVQKTALGFVHTSWKSPYGKINPFHSSVFFQYLWKPKENLIIF